MGNTISCNSIKVSLQFLVNDCYWSVSLKGLIALKSTPTLLLTYEKVQFF